MIEVEAQAAIVAVGEQLQHAPRAGTEIDQQLERPAAQRFDDGLLDVVLGDMQGTNAVPIGGVRLEIGLRRGFTLALQGLGALAVAGDDPIGPVDEPEDVERQAAARRTVGDVKIGPAALAEALDEAGFGQQLQMPADTRLALPEDDRSDP